MCAFLLKLMNLSTTLTTPPPLHPPRPASASHARSETRKLKPNQNTNQTQNQNPTKLEPQPQSHHQHPEIEPINQNFEPKTPPHKSLLAFRDLGPRANRQKSRVMFMIEEMGVEAFRETVVGYVQKIDPSFAPIPAAPAPSEAWTRRDIVGVHPQKQEGKSWVCLTTPAGRLTAEEVRGAGNIFFFQDRSLTALTDLTALTERSPTLKLLIVCSGRKRL